MGDASERAAESAAKDSKAAETEPLECRFCKRKLGKDDWYVVCELCGTVTCCVYYVFHPGPYQSIRFCSRYCWEDGH